MRAMSTEIESRDSRLLVLARSGRPAARAGSTVSSREARFRRSDSQPPRAPASRAGASSRRGAGRSAAGGAWRTGAGAGAGAAGRSGSGLRFRLAGDRRGRGGRRRLRDALFDGGRDGRHGGRDRGLVDRSLAGLGGRSRVDHAVGTGHQSGELVESLDLIGDDTAHVGRRLLGLLRQLDDAAAQFGAGGLQLALDLAGHAAQLAHGVAELRRRIAEGLGHLGCGLLVAGAQGRCRPLAFLARGGADALELLADGARRRLRRGGKDGADLACLGLHVLERAFEEGREGAGDGFQILRAVVDAAEKRVQGLLAAGERLVHARLDTLQGCGGFDEGTHLLAGRIGEGAAALLEGLGEFQRLLDGAGGDAAQRVDLIGHLVRGAARLGGDLGEERFDVLDASGKAVLDRAEIAAGGGGDLLKQLVGVVQAAEHVGELAAQALVGAGERHDRPLGAFVEGRAHGLASIADRRR